MVKRCRVSIIHPADPLGSKVGGAETFIKGLIKHSPDYFDIEFIGVTSRERDSSCGKWSKEKLDGKEFNFFPLFFERDENKKTVIPLSLRFTFFLKFSKIDFSNRVILFNRIEPAILFKKNASPKIAIIHNDIQKQINKYGSEILWSLFPKAYFRIEKSIFGFLDHIFAVSNDTLKFYMLKYPDKKEKLSFMPTWVDTGLFYPAADVKTLLRKKMASSKSFLPVDGQWILFVGRLQEQKAPIRLIDSFFEYQKNISNSRLIIIGDGNLMGQMKKHVEKLNLDGRVIFLGNLNQEALPDFYRASDALLLTSNFEGMPMCVLEALGCGLPVVTTDVGEVKRVVKNGFSGEVVESFDLAEISKALEKVLRNPSVYTKENCVSCTADYNPQKVLAPVYEKMRQLYAERFVGDAEN